VIAGFCQQHSLHYLSNEIYAMSVFENPGHPDHTKINFILSYDTDGIIDRNRIHVLYGMAKDFGSNGLRLGVLHSSSAALGAAVTSIAYDINIRLTLTKR
jgi:1-aminocyclopropane-1-carboxylate synthase